MDEVAPVAAKEFAGVLAGRDRLIVGRERRADGDGGSDSGSDTGSGGGSDSGSDGAGGGGRLAALAFIADGQFRLTEHWRTIKRVMVHPDFQGRGYGVAEVERTARAMGLELVTLECRDGTGNDQFYKKCGYAEYGRLPGALRLGPQDYRDQILMTLALTG
jgi:GNAT superfamily N-acetyltransferase